LTVEQFRGQEVEEDFMSTAEIESADPASFLCQAGYLTLRPGRALDYSLDYPNREVLDAMSAMFTNNLFGASDKKDASQMNLKLALFSGDAPGLVKEFNRLLAALPYDDYAASLRETMEIRVPGLDFGEWLYRSTLLAFLYGAELDVSAEPHSNGGRADIVIRCGDKTWILELKTAENEKGTQRAALDGLSQIKDKGYADRYGRAVLLGLGIDKSARRVAGVAWEEKR
jgi:hypothetical protein